MRDAASERTTPAGGRPEIPAPYRRNWEGVGLLPWSHVETRLQSARNYWLATCRPDGRPHVTPVWGVWVEDALYFDGHPHARWARNIAANGQMSVHLESGEDVVILEGLGEDVNTDEALGDLIVAAWTEKYGQFEPSPVESGLFRFRPSSARAWSTAAGEDATRWQFTSRPA